MLKSQVPIKFYEDDIFKSYVRKTSEFNYLSKDIFRVHEPSFTKNAVLVICFKLLSFVVVCYAAIDDY